MGLHCLMLLWSCPTGSGRGEREAKGKPPSPGCSPWLSAPSRELGTRLEGTATDLHWFEDRGWGRGAKQAVHERQSVGNASRDLCPLQAGLRSFLLKDAGLTWRSAGALTLGKILFSSCKCYCRPIRHLRTYQPICTAPVPSNSSFPGQVPPPRVPSLPNRWELSYLEDILPFKVEGQESRPLPVPST